MRCCISVRERFSIKSSACFTLILQKSLILMPPTVTASISGRRRSPWQSGQGTDDIKVAISYRIHSLLVSLNRRSRLFTIPSKSLKNLPLNPADCLTISNFCPLVPNSTRSSLSRGISFTGISSGTPKCFSSPLKYISPMVPSSQLHPVVLKAPSRMERSGYRITSAGSTF